MRGRLLEGYRRATVDRPLAWRALDLTAGVLSDSFARTLDLFGDGSVRLVSTVGHSPGHLSVLRRTAAGPLLLAGDAAYTRRAIAEGQLSSEGRDGLLHRGDPRRRRRPDRPPCIHLTRTEDSHVTEDGETMPVRVLHAYDCTCGEDCG